MTAHEPAEAAAERQPADAGVRDLAAGHGEPVLLRRGVELSQQRAAADAHDAASRVDVDGVQRAQVDAQRAVTDRAPGNRVPSGPDGERHPGCAGSADRGGDVVGVDRIRDSQRSAVDRAVPARAGSFVVGVGRFDKAADEAVGRKPSARGEVGWQ